MDDLIRVSLGLLAAWAVHDAEELLTMSPASAVVLPELPHWVPIPESIRTRGVSQAHVNLPIGLMAVLVAASSLEGARTRGASPLLRGGVLAFGLHGLGHVAGALARGGYTTGVLTSPTLVIPYWLWASRVLARHGLPRADRGAVLTALGVIPLLPVLHGTVLAILGRRSTRAHQGPWRR